MRIDLLQYMKGVLVKLFQDKSLIYTHPLNLEASAILRTPTI